MLEGRPKNIFVSGFPTPKGSGNAVGVLRSSLAAVRGEALQGPLQGEPRYTFLEGAPFGGGKGGVPASRSCRASTPRRSQWVKCP